MTIDATIQRLTNDGEVVVQFLVDVIQGTNYNAPLGHRIKSAEWLSALGGFIPEDAIPKSATIRPRPKSEPENGKRDKRDKRDKKPSVTEKQILHFDIARLIKQETNDGETVIEFLIRVISKIEKSGENFTPAARMRAAKELLIRGFGSTLPGIRRILSGKTEELDSHISKGIREFTDYGADSVRFLVEAMENNNPEVDSKGADSVFKLMPRRMRKGKPAEGFTASHRVWAACELLRRAYDIRTDHITPDDIQAYWKSQTPAADADHHAAGEHSADAANIADAEKRATQKRNAAAQKPAPDRQPAANSDAAPATETRAARRRQKRAARKAQKRANNTPADHSATPNNAAQPADNPPNANDLAQDNPVDNSKPTTYFNSPEFEARLWRQYHEAKARNAHTMKTDPFYAESGIVFSDPLPPKKWKQWKKNMDYYDLTPEEFYERHGEYPDPNNIPPPLDDP